MFDHFTRKTWVYLIARKDEVYETFKKSKAQAKKTVWKISENIKNRWRGEYLSNDFQNLCEKEELCMKLYLPILPNTMA